MNMNFTKLLCIKAHVTSLKLFTEWIRLVLAVDTIQ